MWGYFNLVILLEAAQHWLIKRWIYNEDVCLNIHATLLSPACGDFWCMTTTFGPRKLRLRLCYGDGERPNEMIRMIIFNDILQVIKDKLLETQAKIAIVHHFTSVAPCESCWLTSSPCLSSSRMSSSMRLSVDARVSFIISWVIPDDGDHKQDRSI